MSRCHTTICNFLQYLHTHPVAAWPQEISSRGEVFELYKSNRTATYLNSDATPWTYAVGNQANIIDLYNWLGQQSIMYEIDEGNKGREESNDA